MKLLKNILYHVRMEAVQGSTQMAITHASADSREIKKDGLFIARRGTHADGHDYIDSVIAQGAAAIICESMPSTLAAGVTYVQVKNSAAAYGQVAANWFDRPADSMKVVGVTGTNGKTTVATLLYNLFQQAGHKCGLLSTVKVCINNEEQAATHTTPDAWMIQSHFAAMRDVGCRFAFMEVSSHGLAQHRTEGIDFSGAIFTNISRDHLDYHKDMNDYVAAKKKLFDDLGRDAFALVNIDEKHGETMIMDCDARVFTYALERPADYKARILERLASGTHISLNNRECWLQLIGDFNVYNAMAIYGTACALEIPEDEAMQALSALKSVDGRFQRIPGPKGILGIVDYAHTPDALANVLNTLKSLKQGDQRIITVVGCGGDRDKGKRPQMASISADLSDYSIFTADNPRTEDPEQILRDMEAGLDPIQKKQCITISDRAAAIKLACQQAQPGDLILVAGKGHETYQEIQGVRHDFDDRKHLIEQLTELHA